MERCVTPETIETSVIFDQPDPAGEIHEGDSDDYSLWQQLYQHLLELAAPWGDAF